MWTKASQNQENVIHTEIRKPISSSAKLKTGGLQRKAETTKNTQTEMLHSHCIIYILSNNITHVSNSVVDGILTVSKWPNLPDKQQLSRHPLIPNMKA